MFDRSFLTRPTAAGAEYVGSMVAAATETFVARFAAELDGTDVDTLRTAAP